jgi:hypothetical protein
MADKIVRFADFQARRGSPPRIPGRKGDGQSRARDAEVRGAEIEEFSVVVEVKPPDLVTVTMTHSLWSVMADWLAAQRVRFTIVPPQQPGRPPRQRRPGREEKRA